MNANHRDRAWVDALSALCKARNVAISFRSGSPSWPEHGHKAAFWTLIDGLTTTPRVDGAQLLGVTVQGVPEFGNDPALNRLNPQGKPFRFVPLRVYEGSAGTLLITCLATKRRAIWNEAARAGWVGDLNGKAYAAYYSPEGRAKASA